MSHAKHMPSLCLWVHGVPRAPHCSPGKHRELPKARGREAGSQCALDLVGARRALDPPWLPEGRGSSFPTYPKPWEPLGSFGASVKLAACQLPFPILSPFPARSVPALTKPTNLSSEAHYQTWLPPASWPQEQAPMSSDLTVQGPKRAPHWEDTGCSRT